jgi:hypothetical protein
MLCEYIRVVNCTTPKYEEPHLFENKKKKKERNPFGNKSSLAELPQHFPYLALLHALA